LWEPIRWLALEIEGGAAAPLLREAFFFEGGIQVYEPPSVAAIGRFGAAVRFP
jgi:hypothetical protein